MVVAELSATPKSTSTWINPATTLVDTVDYVLSWMIATIIIKCIN